MFMWNCLFSTGDCFVLVRTQCLSGTPRQWKGKFKNYFATCKVKHTRNKPQDDPELKKCSVSLVSRTTRWHRDTVPGMWLTFSNAQRHCCAITFFGAVATSAAFSQNMLVGSQSIVLVNSSQEKSHQNVSTKVLTTSPIDRVTKVSWCKRHVGSVHDSMIHHTIKTQPVNICIAVCRSD